MDRRRFRARPSTRRPTASGRRKTMSVIDLLAQQPVAQAIGWALLQFVWQGAVLGVLTALLLEGLRRSAPYIPYFVSSIALAMMATLPLVTALQAGRSAAARDARVD